MTSQIVYTIGIIIALFFLLLFLRSAFVRRTRTQGIPYSTTVTGAPRIVVFGGGWRDGGIGAMGTSTTYRVPTDLPRPTPAATRSPRRPTDETVEDLPRYEAPPDYETATKMSAQSAGAEGEGSSGRRDGEVAINMPQPPPSPTTQQAADDGVIGQVRSVWGRVVGR